MLRSMCNGESLCLSKFQFAGLKAESRNVAKVKRGQRPVWRWLGVIVGVDVGTEEVGGSSWTLK